MPVRGCVPQVNGRSRRPAPVRWRWRHEAIPGPEARRADLGRLGGVGVRAARAPDVPDRAVRRRPGHLAMGGRAEGGTAARGPAHGGGVRRPPGRPVAAAALAHPERRTRCRRRHRPGGEPGPPDTATAGPGQLGGGAAGARVAAPDGGQRRAAAEPPAVPGRGLRARPLAAGRRTGGQAWRAAAAHHGADPRGPGGRPARRGVRPALAGRQRPAGGLHRAAGRLEHPPGRARRGAAGGRAPDPADNRAPEVRPTGSDRVPARLNPPDVVAGPRPVVARWRGAVGRERATQREGWAWASGRTTPSGCSSWTITRCSGGGWRRPSNWSRTLTWWARRGTAAAPWRRRRSCCRTWC